MPVICRNRDMKVIARHDSTEAILWWGSEIAMPRVLGARNDKKGKARDDTRFNTKEQKLPAFLSGS